MVFLAIEMNAMRAPTYRDAPTAHVRRAAARARARAPGRESVRSAVATSEIGALAAPRFHKAVESFPIVVCRSSEPGMSA